MGHLLRIPHISLGAAGYGDSDERNIQIAVGGVDVVPYGPATPGIAPNTVRAGFPINSAVPSVGTSWSVQSLTVSYSITGRQGARVIATSSQVSLYAGYPYNLIDYLFTIETPTETVDGSSNADESYAGVSGMTQVFTPELSIPESVQLYLEFTSGAYNVPGSFHQFPGSAYNYHIEIDVSMHYNILPNPRKRA